MKCIVISGVFLFCFGFTHGQATGSLTPVRDQVGINCTYYYRPPVHLLVPDSIHASLVYKKAGVEKQYFETVPIYKTGGRYRFSYTASDSVQALIIGISDQKGGPVDNNDGLGFVVYLADRKGHVPASAYLEAADLLSYHAPPSLKLDREKMAPEEIRLMKNAYRLNPALKNESGYTFYLYLLYKEKKDSVRPELLAYAHKMASAGNDEAKWLNALSIYQTLRMTTEYTKLEARAIAVYPNGKAAQAKFLRDFDNEGNYTEQSILASRDAYVKQFKDTSAQMRFTFYNWMIGILLNKREWSKIPEYEPLLDDNGALASLYDYYAGNLCGRQLDSSGSDLEMAKFFSRKALDLTETQIRLLPPNQNDGILQNTFDRYIGTYALILYKSGLYDSAFYYQDALYQKGNGLDEESLKRYTTYAEKAKGAAFASRIRDKSLKPATEEAEREMLKRLGTIRNKDFTLKNLDGEPVSLSSLRNKVIVLDFWASWCSPCKASFPAMQKIVSSYKSDTDVVFLFIDTWEYKGRNDWRENLTRFIKGNDYTFPILLDENSKVVDAYKVEAIPTTFILNKRGDIVFTGETENLPGEIEKARNDPFPGK